MLVINQFQTRAIVIAHDGHQVVLVPMRSGKLSARRLPADRFLEEWSDCPDPLAPAIASFLHHADEQGASQEVLRGLQRLAARDRAVLAPLF